MVMLKESENHDDPEDKRIGFDNICKDYNVNEQQIIASAQDAEEFTMEAVKKVAGFHPDFFESDSNAGFRLAFIVLSGMLQPTLIPADDMLKAAMRLVKVACYPKVPLLPFSSVFFRFIDENACIKCRLDDAALLPALLNVITESDYNGLSDDQRKEYSSVGVDAYASISTGEGLDASVRDLISGYVKDGSFLRVAFYVAAVLIRSGTKADTHIRDSLAKVVAPSPLTTPIDVTDAWSQSLKAKAVAYGSTIGRLATVLSIAISPAQPPAMVEVPDYMRFVVVRLQWAQMALLAQVIGVKQRYRKPITLIMDSILCAETYSGVCAFVRYESKVQDASRRKADDELKAMMFARVINPNFFTSLGPAENAFTILVLMLLRVDTEEQKEAVFNMAAFTKYKSIYWSVRDCAHRALLSIIPTDSASMARGFKSALANSYRSHPAPYLVDEKAQAARMEYAPPKAGSNVAPNAQASSNVMTSLLSKFGK